MHPRHPLFTSLLSVTLLTLTACGGSSSSAPPLDTTPIDTSPDYQAIMNTAVESVIPGMIMTIQGPEIDFIGAAGLADKAQQLPMQTYHKMFAGSAGKKATALLAIQLHEEGMLNIDDKLGTWLSEDILSRIENSDDMTLRMLLNHTAGVYDYLDGNTSQDWFQAAMDDLDTLKGDAYALTFALDKPAYFAPGQGVQYSNTGYLLTGLILDQVLGEHHSVALRNRVFIPLGLNDTYYSGYENNLGNAISGYLIQDGEELNTHDFYQNIGVSDAPLVTTVTDLDNLLRAIITDSSVITDDMRALFFGEASLVTYNDTLSFGLGVFKDNIEGRTVYHHGGDEAGYRTFNYYIEDTQTSLTVFYNCNGYTACLNKTDAVTAQILTTLL